MNSELISKIWIDDNGRLCIQPQSELFELIYRSARGVQWSTDDHYLYPYYLGAWSPIDWYRQIVKVVENDYECKLYVSQTTKWENIDDSFKMAIQMENK